jgi:hypothetical protein
MRNVRSALLVAAVVSLSTACSFSSSRSWGSANNNPDDRGTGKPALHSSKGKPAQHSSSKGKPAQHDPAPAPTPAAKPAPAPAPEAVPPEETDPPTRVGRDDETKPTSEPTKNTTISAKPVEPKPPVGKVGLASEPAPAKGKAIKAAPPKPEPPRGLKIAPAQPDPSPPATKAAPNR